MAREFEIVSHSQFRHLNIFLVQLVSRSAHIHRETELGLVLEGRVELQIGRERWLLEAGDIYLVNSMDAHAFAAEGKGALILSIQLSRRLMESFLTEAPNLQFYGSPRVRDHFDRREGDYDRLALLCMELAHTYLSREADHEYRCFALSAKLLCDLRRQLPNRQLSRQDYLPLAQKTDRILSVSNYIDEHFTHKLLLEDIARREGVSMPYLSHLFKDTLGISFQDYLKEKRFEYACGLIAGTDRKILDISLSSGFSDVRYLTKLFQERFGCTPRQYRQAGQAPRRTVPIPSESSERRLSPQEALQRLEPILENLRDRIRNKLLTGQMDVDVLYCY